ncbi:LOW QUALITY PROTEIN: WD40-repeat-containing domain protein [Jimgerdemannia flammicorona]|uniref:WD40-repeat-containing domain protein n=1 Tax=Jimgerdemannia flammicorona TaxID=994334 RepID=A0A433QA78_9FUNG|nr:LOW QUALITY PROTEIN: WD40-repeat-containing domain protein [Jimgerdemannia flammicorona]
MFQFLSDTNSSNNVTVVVCFDRRGEHIYAGTTKGFLNIIDVKTRKVVVEIKISVGEYSLLLPVSDFISINNSISYTPCGLPTHKSNRYISVARATLITVLVCYPTHRDFVVNANDRIIRVLHLRDEDGLPEVQHKFQDLVNRVQWNQTCFSADGDFVIGGSAHKAEHNIYIWDKNMGNLVKILEGPKEPLDDLVKPKFENHLCDMLMEGSIGYHGFCIRAMNWHPIRPIIASVSSYGNVHIWATNHEENWSAFAPDFKELEENLEYEEREDEFDVVPEEEVSKRKQDDEDIIVDVVTTDNINPFNDSDTDGPDDIFYLPTRPDEDQNIDGEGEAVAETGRKKVKHVEGDLGEIRVAKKKKRSHNDV